MNPKLPPRICLNINAAILNTTLAVNPLLPSECWLSPPPKPPQKSSSPLALNLHFFPTSGGYRQRNVQSAMVNVSTE